MAIIAKVSIGQFAPGDTLKGIDQARLNELIDAGYAEDDGEVDKSAKAPPKPKVESAKASETKE